MGLTGVSIRAQTFFFFQNFIPVIVLRPCSYSFEFPILVLRFDSSFLLKVTLAKQPANQIAVRGALCFLNSIRKNRIFHMYALERRCIHYYCSTCGFQNITGVMNMAAVISVSKVQGWRST